MKKLIGIVFISLMFANIGFAEIRLIEDKVVKSQFQKGYAKFYVAILCVDGYKFVVTKGGDGRSIVQHMRRSKPGGDLVPAKC